MPLARPSLKERKLLYFIWALLALAGLILVFWPRNRPDALPEVSIQLAPELQSWFSGGMLTRFSNQGLAVELKFHKKPLQALEQVRSVHIGYDLGREKEILYRGNIVWSPRADGRMAGIKGDKRARGPQSEQISSDKALPLLLPNPQGIVPRWVRLYFADSR